MMNGADVGIWQYRMKHTHGYLFLAADTWFGANTDFVTRDFQARKGLVVDGIVGPVTWAAA